jgi:hypothetical protein
MSGQRRGRLVDRRGDVISQPQALDRAVADHHIEPRNREEKKECIQCNSARIWKKQRNTDSLGVIDLASTLPGTVAMSSTCCLTKPPATSGAVKSSSSYCIKQ